jgi:8-oxo-dGTP pyrophosphatase MutT (NUDIX family)
VTIIVEGERSFWMSAQAVLVDETREMAWAEAYIKRDPVLRWITGRFAETERANLNGHIFPAEDMPAAADTLPNKPLNLLHFPDKVVGHFVAQQLIVPDATAAAGDQTVHAYIDALSAFYAYYFPDQLKKIEKAHAEGRLAYSMECHPDSLTCTAEGCGIEAAYDGRQSPAYCAHMNSPGGPKRLNRPSFIGGALILPPANPAWPKADITALTAVMEEHAAEADLVYRQVASQFPHLDRQSAELLTAQVVQLAERELADAEQAVLYAAKYNMADRMRLAKDGKALQNGSYPIDSLADLKNAITLARSGHGNVAAAKKLILRRAKELGGESLLPSDWRPTVMAAAASRIRRPFRASALVAAGLCVKAADTGRVLMLQRCITDDTDPAAGTWEFPGGHIEDDETPFDAARREWEEETGTVLPAGEMRGSWTSPNGVYQAFVYVVRSESDVRANTNAADRHVLNPDDPDGDMIEVCAWWDPKDLPGMPALRPECQTTDWAAIEAASISELLPA